MKNSSMFHLALGTILGTLAGSCGYPLLLIAVTSDNQTNTRLFAGLSLLFLLAGFALIFNWQVKQLQEIDKRQNAEE